MQIKRFWLGLSFCFALVFPFFAQAQTISQFTLTNGLQVIVKPVHRSPVVMVQIWYKVGSSYENNGTTGISHVLEHMMFQGTSRYPAGQFNALIASHGGIQNAMTSQDFTVYFEELPAQYLGLAFELEADRMAHLNLTQPHFQKEMSVVKTEKRLRFDNDPQGLIYLRFLATAHVSNPYHHSPIGWQSDLDNMTLQNVKNWYQTWYAPNNAVLVVVGDVTIAQVKQFATQYFGALPSKTIPILKPRPEQASFGQRTVNINAPANLPMMIMGFNTPNYAHSVNKNDAAALTMLNAVLGLNNNSRLSMSLIKQQSIASMIQSNFDSFTLHDDLLTIFAIPANNVSLDILKTNILKQIKLLQTTPISKTELARAKVQFIAQKIYDQDSLSTQALNIGNLAVISLPYTLDQDLLLQLQAITPLDIERVAKKYLTPDNMTVATLIPNAIKPEPITQFNGSGIQ